MEISIKVAFLIQKFLQVHQTVVSTPSMLVMLFRVYGCFQRNSCPFVCLVPACLSEVLPKGLAHGMCNLPVFRSIRECPLLLLPGSSSVPLGSIKPLQHGTYCVPSFSILWGGPCRMQNYFSFQVTLFISAKPWVYLILNQYVLDLGLTRTLGKQVGKFSPGTSQIAEVPRLNFLLRGCWRKQRCWFFFVLFFSLW